tara:strand:+ start:2685 stop:4118 length:1434 start_codon:yes stop_codon:yes gene_type:complete
MNGAVTVGTFLISMLGVSLAHAGPFKKGPSCGDARVVSGDTCSNVKVEFQFSGCEHKSSPEMAKKIICEGNEIKARYQTENYRFQARFKKSDDGWGGVSWAPVGSVEQYIKSEPKPSKHAKADKPKEQAVAFEKTERAPSAAYDLKALEQARVSFSGFADIRYSNYTVKDNTSLRGQDESGFLMADGAAYGSYKGDKLSIYGDLPFRRSHTSNVSSDAAIELGKDKAQFYMSYDFHENFSAQLGQFDTIYGVELNDSKDRLFGTAGQVYSNTLPVVHTGLLLDFHMDGAYAKALIANPSDRGSYGAAGTNKDNNTEYGLALGYSNDMIRGQVGYLSRPWLDIDGTSMSNRSLLDFILGATFGHFSIDLEYNMVNVPNKNTLTTSTTDSEDAGKGLLALASYEVTDEIGVALRYENLKDDPAAGSIDETNSYGLGLHYTMDKNLQLHAEYIASEFTPTGTNPTKWKSNLFEAGVILSF